MISIGFQGRKECPPIGPTNGANAGEYLYAERAKDS